MFWSNTLPASALVFVSSWSLCTSCKKHLIGSKIVLEVLIGWLDQGFEAERNLPFFGSWDTFSLALAKTKQLYLLAWFVLVQWTFVIRGSNLWSLNGMSFLWLRWVHRFDWATQNTAWVKFMDRVSLVLFRSPRWSYLKQLWSVYRRLRQQISFSYQVRSTFLEARTLCASGSCAGCGWDLSSCGKKRWMQQCLLSALTGAMVQAKMDFLSGLEATAQIALASKAPVLRHPY